MRKLHFGVDLATLANIVREVELHRSDGWAKGVPIVTGDGRVIVSGRRYEPQSGCRRVHRAVEDRKDHAESKDDHDDRTDDAQPHRQGRGW